jgi:hypothetical protein
VNVDTTPPTVTRFTPTDRDVFADGDTVLIQGTAADHTSGIASVSCGTTFATLQGQTYSCLVPAQGTDATVIVTARDVAGLARTHNVTLNMTAPPEPKSLEISPSTITMIVGASQSVSVSDEGGHQVSGGTWTVNNPSVAAITSVDGEWVISALSVGQATLTVTRGVLTASASVNVFATAADIPQGSILWSLSPPIGSQAVPKRAQILQPGWADLGKYQPHLFFVNESIEWAIGGPGSTGGWYRPYGRPTVLRATTRDGRLLWHREISGGIVYQYAADEHGGAVVLIANENNLTPSPEVPSGYLPHRIRRIDGASGRTSWEYHAPWDNDNASNISEFAIGPDGFVYFVEHVRTKYQGRAFLRSLDAQTGAGSGWELQPSDDGFGAIQTTAPLIRADGSVTLLSVRRIGSSRQLHRVVLSAGVTRNISQTVIPGMPENFVPSRYRLMPDGHDGLLIVPSKPAGTANVPSQGGGLFTGTLESTVYRISADNTLSGPLTLHPRTSANYSDAIYHQDFVLGDDAVWAHVAGLYGSGQHFSKVFSFDPISLALITETMLDQPPFEPAYLRVRAALAGGGVYLSGPTSVYAVGGSAAGLAAIPHGTDIGGSLWAGMSNSVGHYGRRCAGHPVKHV